MKSKVNVLLVEDNDMDAKLIEKALRDGGLDIEVQRVQSQDDFIDALKKPVDLVLSDFSLPQFDGLKALNIFKQMKLTVPFILVTGSIEDEAAVAIMQAGAQDYVLKDQLIKLAPLAKKELAEAKIREENRRLIYSDLVKSEFLSTMSHELRTPLNAIISYADLLATQTCGALNEKQVKFCENISDSGRHLLSLINDILDLSKIDAGKSKISEEVLDLSFLLQEALDMVSCQLKNKDIQFNLICDPNLRRCVFDRRRLNQIIYNLLSNAIKFTPDKGCVSIITNLIDDDTVQIIVKDTGIGFDENCKGTVFEPFSQFSKDRTLRNEGFGLGLMIVKKLVDLHHGEIHINSQPGKGTECELLFPHRRAKSHTQAI